MQGNTLADCVVDEHMNCCSQKNIMGELCQLESISAFLFTAFVLLDLSDSDNRQLNVNYLCRGNLLVEICSGSRIVSDGCVEFWVGHLTLREILFIPASYFFFHKRQ